MTDTAPPHNESAIFAVEQVQERSVVFRNELRWQRWRRATVMPLRCVQVGGLTTQPFQQQQGTDRC